MLVGAGVMGRGYVDAARALGLRIVLLDEPQYRSTYEDVVDVFATPSGRTEAHWMRGALAVAGQHQPDGVVPFSEQHVLASAWVQDRHGLPGPSLAAADASRNKAIQRMLFADLDQPDFEVVASVADAVEWSRLRYPVVVKPLRGMGSAGVRCVADESALLADLAGRDVAEQLLVESYVDAQEYSWEGLVQDGKIVFGNYTHKMTTGAPEFVELAHRLPADVDRARLDPQLAALVTAAGIGSSLVHLEFRDTGSVVYPMEFAVRTPGDHIMELVCRAHGHDVFASVLELALGRPVTVPGGSPRAAGVVYLPAPGPGRITAIEGADAVSALPSVVRFGQKKQVGDVVGGLRSSGDRVAHALVVADTLAELDAELHRIPELVEIRVDAEEAPADA